MSGSEEATFRFTLLPSSTLASIKDKSKEAVELFEKWGLVQNLKSCSFSFDNHFQAYLKEMFALDFFKSQVVYNTFLTEIEGVYVEVVPCTVISMDFFDRLLLCGVVRESGYIFKCFDEVCGDFVISDELRKMLLLEDSDHFAEFSDNEKKEFLFRLFKHLVLGGRVNQYEDVIHPYLDTTKLLYKEFLTVVKNSTTNNLSISQTVLKVQAKVKDEVVFPKDFSHPQSFCYLIIDNVKRTVTTFSHNWN